MAGSRYKRARDGSAAKPAKKRRVAPQPRKRAASVLPPETKYFDVAFSQTVASAADWTGTEVPCTEYITSDGTTLAAYTNSALIPSAVGAGYGQVIGTKYFLKALRARGQLISTPAADGADAVQATTVVVCLVHDTQPNGAQAQGEEVFTDMGAATQCSNSFQAMGAGAGGRFRILKRKLFVLQPAVMGTDGTNTNSQVNNTAAFSFEYQPKKAMLNCIKGNSATPTVASLSDNNVFLLAHASQGNPPCTIVGCARAYYQD